MKRFGTYKDEIDKEHFYTKSALHRAKGKHRGCEQSELSILCPVLRFKVTSGLQVLFRLLKFVTHPIINRCICNIHIHIC